MACFVKGGDRRIGQRKKVGTSKKTRNTRRERASKSPSSDHAPQQDLLPEWQRGTLTRCQGRTATARKESKKDKTNAVLELKYCSLLLSLEINQQGPIEMQHVLVTYGISSERPKKRGLMTGLQWTWVGMPDHFAF